MFHRNTVVSLTLLVVAGVAMGALFEAPTEQVLRSDYDVVVVGGGAGGAVMASRLTEDPHVRVLLLEAGGSDYTNINISVPGLSATLPRSKFDWNFTTTPQAALGDRSILYPRGYVLGGSTAINQMVFCRGTEDDYNRWARVTEDDGWSWKKLLPFVRKVDRMTAPADGHDTTGQFNPLIHGSGVVPISVEGFPLDINPLVINTTRELPEEFPFNLDYNSGNTIGISWAQSTIYRGRRVSSATSYLAQALSRPNLDIVVNTRVTKIVPVGQQFGRPVMRGVQFAQTLNGTYYTVYARKEVILSAGSIKTPHILMLSGIGNAAYLSSMGIQSIVDLPSVGQNLHDHAFLSASWFVNSNDTLDNISRNSTLAAELLARWKIDGTGPLGLATSQFAWLHVPNASHFFASLGVEDPSAGPTSAHFELLPSEAFRSRSIPPPDEGNFFSFITAVISPTARGNISLASAHPFDAPLINPNILGTAVDLAIMRESLKAARAFVAATPWSDYIIREFGAFADAKTDEQLDAYIRDNADTIYHPVGSVAMGNGKEGALDSQLRVRGTVGLRVVDASAFPFIPSAHTQGPTYILAERAAALVQAAL